MILTGKEIEKEINSGNITISPFNLENLNPNSYNYSLGNSIIEIPNDVSFDSKKKYNFISQEIPKNGLILEPNRLYLCNTFEKIGSNKYITSLIGKSSIGRLGLFLQISADLGHQGEIHNWTLELRCCKSLRIYPEMIIGQVTFWQTYGRQFESNGYYKLFDSPKTSKGI